MFQPASLQFRSASLFSRSASLSPGSIARDGCPSHVSQRQEISRSSLSKSLQRLQTLQPRRERCPKVPGPCHGAPRPARSVALGSEDSRQQNQDFPGVTVPSTQVTRTFEHGVATSLEVTTPSADLRRTHQKSPPCRLSSRGLPPTGSRLSWKLPRHKLLYANVSRSRVPLPSAARTFANGIPMSPGIAAP